MHRCKQETRVYLKSHQYNSLSSLKKHKSIQYIHITELIRRVNIVIVSSVRGSNPRKAALFEAFPFRFISYFSFVQILTRKFFTTAKYPKHLTQMIYIEGRN